MAFFSLSSLVGLTLTGFQVGRRDWDEVEELERNQYYSMRENVWFFLVQINVIMNQISFSNEESMSHSVLEAE